MPLQNGQEAPDPLRGVTTCTESGTSSLQKPGGGGRVVAAAEGSRRRGRARLQVALGADALIAAHGPVEAARVALQHGGEGVNHYEEEEEEEGLHHCDTAGVALRRAGGHRRR